MSASSQAYACRLARERRKQRKADREAQRALEATPPDGPDDLTAGDPAHQITEPDPCGPGEDARDGADTFPSPHQEATTMASAADRDKSANPNLGKSNPVAIGKTAAEGKAAGDAANAAFKVQLNNQFEKPLPKPPSTD